MHPLQRSVFLTGTDTGVGKTHVASLLLRSWRSAGCDAVGFKPLCCGERSDAELLHAASDAALSLNEVNPVWLRPPAAPYTAALIENRPIDLALIRETFSLLTQRHARILVEGVGGWRVPILADYDLSDLAAEFKLPVVVVAANRLGALNHTRLTVDAIKASGLECAGVILSHPSPDPDPIAAATNRSVLEQLLSAPVLAEIAHGQHHWE
jgi:dethiobiotin synthetase